MSKLTIICYWLVQKYKVIDAADDHVNESLSTTQVVWSADALLRKSQANFCPTFCCNCPFNFKFILIILSSTSSSRCEVTYVPGFTADPIYSGLAQQLRPTSIASTQLSCLFLWSLFQNYLRQILHKQQLPHWTCGPRIDLKSQQKKR